MASALPRVLKMKVCLVGEFAVGKTSTVRRFVLNQFSDRYIQTIGTKVSKRTITFSPETGQALYVDMTVWDIMGERGFRELLKRAYFAGARGILAVCDLTRRDTLADLDGWIKAVRQVAPNAEVVFLGNKVDLVKLRQVTDAELADAAARHGATAFLTSAKTGENVEAAFERMAQGVLRHRAESDDASQLLEAQPAA